ncbi:MAG: tetratricopeptide repeat protein [Planctomycetota bacterium]
MIALLLAFAAAPQQGPPPGAIPAEAPAPEERPAILLRTPDTLPRAADGAWEAFLASEDPNEAFAGLDPEIVARMAAAEEHYRAARYPSALQALYDALERAPGFPPGLMLLGTTYFRLRRYEDCRESLQQFLEVAPGDVWRTQALGHALYSLGDYGGARDHYEAVLAASPEELGESPEALRGLALCHMRLGDPERALSLLARVIELRPGHAEAFTFRARILYDEDRLDEALAAAERARELSPYEPQPWFLTMRILYDLGRDDEAAEAEQRWQELDRVAQDVRALEMRLRFRPGQYPLILRLCELFVSIGDVGRARNQLAQLVLARPDDIPEVAVRIFVVDTLNAMGDAEGTHVAALALEESCPDDAEAWRRLERYYALRRDRVNQVRCGAEAARLEAASEDSSSG